MKKHNLISEQYIINKYLIHLNNNKVETFNFKNDGAYFKIPKSKNLIVTNDTIIENIDFFKNDPPGSVAKKIVTCNLSDISSMGAYPYSYTLSLCLPKNISDKWLKEFTRKLSLLQKKYNFFLIGGDLSKFNKIIISSNFFGFVSKDKILKRTGAIINDDIWVTGNIGDSSIGLKVIKNKLKINNFDKKFFVNKYLYPDHCHIGNILSNYVNSAIDISDGFYGDLNYLLDQNKYGASLNSNSIPFSNKTKKLLRKKIVDFNFLLSAGDDYQLIFTSNIKFSSIIKRIANQNNIKITKVGKIIEKKGIYLDNNKINVAKKSYQHFS